MGDVVRMKPRPKPARAQWAKDARGIGFWSAVLGEHHYTIDRTERRAYIVLRHHVARGAVMRGPEMVGFAWTLREAKEAAENDARRGGGG